MVVRWDKAYHRLSSLITAYYCLLLLITAYLRLPLSYPHNIFSFFLGSFINIRYICTQRQ